MNKRINLLITAVGSELAFSVIKAAKLASLPLRLIGCDIHPEVVGKYWCDNFRMVPPATHAEEYITAIRELIKTFDIHALVPTANAEFEILATVRRMLLDELGCRVLINPLEEIRRFNDKWEAYKWYQESDIPSPKTYLAATPEEIHASLTGLTFPMILKPRVGGGSRHIHTIHTLAELNIHQPTVPQPILQEYVFPDDEEYTAGTYRSMNGDIQVIILKRWLKFGMTNKAVSLTDRPDLEKFCREAIQRTNLEGSNNIQFRLGHDGPTIMEINPRFSGTIGIRAHCGFNDLEMWLTEALGIGNIALPVVRKRFVMRYMEELYIDAIQEGLRNRHDQE